MSSNGKRRGQASPATKRRPRSPPRATSAARRAPVTPRFRTGDRVCVRAADPPGHVRTPHYTRGRCGIIDSHAGDFANPEERAYGRSGEPAVPLYRVRFEQRELWPDYRGEPRDTLVVDIYENWLEPAAPAPRRSRAAHGESKT